MDAILPGLLLLSHAASAGHLEAARTAERAGDHTGEHRACTALLADSPGGSGSEACRRRLVWLDARRDADGGFA
ncbi:MAG: hypothetical protein VX000_02285, partial [Myxococcota bacterium]|nr:hypothetical protein [Myxococcota bacterium]